MEDNEHLQHIKTELEEIEDQLDGYQVPYHILQRMSRLRSYVNQLTLVKPNPAGLVRLCYTCGEEEANPGLDVCGQCYSKSINGH